MDSDLNLRQAAYKQTIYDPNDVAKTTTKEQLIHDDRDGNVDRLEDVGPGAYANTEYDAKNTNKQFTSDNQYFGSGYDKAVEGYNTSEHDAKETHKQFTSDNDYTGIAGPGGEDKSMSYSDMYNACISEVKEMVLEGREPTKTSNKSTSGSDYVNLDIQKLEGDRASYREFNNQNRVYSNTSSEMNNACKLTNNKETIKQDINLERTNPELLNAFRKNPYTQSLNSIA